MDLIVIIIMIIMTCDSFKALSVLPFDLQVLKSQGYSKLLLQIGRGSFEPDKQNSEGVHIEYYRYKDSIHNDIEEADLVISHAG